MEGSSKNHYEVSLMRYFACILILFLSGCGENLTQKNHIVIGESKPIQSTFTPKEARLKLSYEKPYLLFFFTKTCGACKEAIPYLNELAQKYQGQIEVIGILGGSSRSDDDITFLKKYNVTFKMISEPQSSEYFSKAVGGVYGVPLFAFFSEDGKEMKRFLGLVPKSLLEETAKTILPN